MAKGYYCKTIGREMVQCTTIDFSVSYIFYSHLSFADMN